MPFVDVPIGKKGWALLIGMVGMFGFGELMGIHLERVAQQRAHDALVDPVAQVLQEKANPLANNPTDALIWSAFLPQAKVCDTCNALQEFNKKPYYSSRPLVFRIRGEEVGNTSNVAYTMVLGIISRDSEGGGHQILPRIIYYVGHKSGSLARIDELGNVEYRVGFDQWRSAKDGSALVTEVRKVFQDKWKQELATQKM